MAVRAFNISATNAVPRCSPAARADPTTGASAGAAFASATSLSRSGKSGAARRRLGSTISGDCLAVRETRSAFKRKPAPDLIRGGDRFASRKRVKLRFENLVSTLNGVLGVSLARVGAAGINRGRGRLAQLVRA